MFRKILVANRGEIACRVMKTARRMGIRTVAIYSDADADALHVLKADEAVHVGGAASADSYLNMTRIIDAARQTAAQAIHPGYGFLSENAEFASLCESSDLTFIGPPAGAIEAMGSKSAAKGIMEKAGVPLLAGYHGDDQNPEVLKEAAGDIGYPVLLKAVAGGGGKGMRQIPSANKFDEALLSAKREAGASFGNDAMLVEKLLDNPRHVEVQVFCDTKGNGVYLFERDCSIQRRHQKIIEEAPAPGISAELRERMGDAATRAALAIDYVGAGTVEFLLAEDDTFYFMEMNTRLQVEHPVTEMVTGQDLVEWQLRVAAGETLPHRQVDLSIKGHAFEARIYAEDPGNDFLPAAGTLRFLQTPQESNHVRIDSGVVQGDDIGVFYDPMIAKLIVWDENRKRAVQRLSAALAQYRIRGVTTNVDFLRRVAEHSAFMDGAVHTGFIDEHREDLFNRQETDTDEVSAIAACYLALRREESVRCQLSGADPASPWQAYDNWRLNGPRIHRDTIIVDGVEIALCAEEVGQGKPRHFRILSTNEPMEVHGTLDGNQLHLEVNGHLQRYLCIEDDGRVTLFSAESAYDFDYVQSEASDETDHHGDDAFLAPMNGTVVEILASPGARVQQGDTILVIEAMKMEHAIRAPVPGTVGEIYYRKGELVEGGARLIEFEAEVSE